MHDFTKTNILMRFSFKSNEQVIFVYSNLNGLNHMEQTLAEHTLFSNLLTPKEILIKLSYEISYDFSRSDYTGVRYCEWVGKKMLIMPAQEKDFFKSFETWFSQLEIFMGKENLFKVSILENELEIFEDANLGTDEQKNINFMNFIETYRLKLHLSNSLSDKPVSKNNIKI